MQILMLPLLACLASHSLAKNQIHVRYCPIGIDTYISISDATIEREAALNGYSFDLDSSRAVDNVLAKFKANSDSAQCDFDEGNLRMLIYSAQGSLLKVDNNAIAKRKDGCWKSSPKDVKLLLRNLMNIYTK